MSQKTKQNKQKDTPSNMFIILKNFIFTTWEWQE